MLNATIQLESWRKYRKLHPIPKKWQKVNYPSKANSTASNTNNEWNFNVGDANRFQTDWNYRLKNHAKCADYMRKKPLIWNINDIVNVNDVILDMDAQESDVCNEICKTNGKIIKLFVPESNCNGIVTLDDSRCSAFICGNHSIYGIILFNVTSQQIYHKNDVACIKIQIRGRGRFYKPFNTQYTAANKFSTQTSMHHLNSQYLKMDINTNLGLDTSIANHQIGFVLKALDYKHSGDINGAHSIYGLVLSPSSTYFCIFCHITKEEREATPTIANRANESRSFSSMMDSCCIASRGDANTINNDAVSYKETFGSKYTPLFNATPMQLVPPTMHIFTGILNVFVKAFENQIITNPLTRSNYNKIQQQQMIVIQTETEYLHKKQCATWLKNELHVSFEDSIYNPNQNSIVSDKNEISQIENDATEEKEDLEMKNDENENSDSSIEPDSSVCSTDASDIEMDKTKKNNTMLIQILKEQKFEYLQMLAAKKKLKKLKKETFKSNQVIECETYKKDLQVKDSQYFDSSIEGRSAYNFVKNRDVVNDILRNKYLECAEMFAILLEQLNFMMDCLWKKNYVPFNQDLLNELKATVINFEYLYKIFIAKYGSNVKGKTTVKVHLLLHCYEYVEFCKHSPAWHDDQRIEAMNQLYKKFYSLFSKFWNEKQLLKLVNYILLHCGIRWDCTNKL